MGRSTRYAVTLLKGVLCLDPFQQQSTVDVTPSPAPCLGIVEDADYVGNATLAHYATSHAKH